MWKNLFIVFFVFFTELSCAAKYSLQNDDFFCYKTYITEIQQERAIFYNALNLSDEQVKVLEDFLNSNGCFYEQKFAELKKESLKLKALKAAGASERDIFCQKNAVKKVKNEIDNFLSKENKEYKKCLTRDQRAKYSMINKLVRLECKRKLHCKDYYKSNPQMKYFGNPSSDSCSVCDFAN